ncbi:MAG: hypothetical protein J1E40_11765 [Oscillospiraceae bacterium]|nr:hypothetical protein [Oscillospiraceae bacterium]
MYTIRKIESAIELPYDLIDINTGSEHFIFQFISFDDNQTDRSIEMGGVTGKFGIIYQSKGIDCNFECDISVGNVYTFYYSLDTAYDIMSGRNAVSVLSDYGDTLNRTNLTITFDNKGRCLMDGYFKNKDDLYKSSIAFSFKIEHTDISDMLISMDKFFHELIRVQGHNNFI